MPRSDLHNEIKTILGHGQPLERLTKINVIRDTARIEGIEVILKSYMLDQYRTDRLDDLTDDQLSRVFSYVVTACNMLRTVQGVG
tara:strand:- start:1207 stop:1461 length:255 start_codon:yes stop_codon:yes gene_type:complete